AEPGPKEEAPEPTIVEPPKRTARAKKRRSYEDSEKVDVQPNVSTQPAETPAAKRKKRTTSDDKPETAAKSESTGTRRTGRTARGAKTTEPVESKTAEEVAAEPVSESAEVVKEIPKPTTAKGRRGAAKTVATEKAKPASRSTRKVSSAKTAPAS